MNDVPLKQGQNDEIEIARDESMEDSQSPVSDLATKQVQNVELVTSDKQSSSDAKLPASHLAINQVQNAHFLTTDKPSTAAIHISDDEGSFQQVSLIPKDYIVPLSSATKKSEYPTFTLPFLKRQTNQYF